jgi:hypothetical protein
MLIPDLTPPPETISMAQQRGSHRYGNGHNIQQQRGKMESCISERFIMPTAKMKDGRTLEVPLDELVAFLSEHAEDIELQQEEGTPLRSFPKLNNLPFTQTAELSHQG